MVKQLSITLSDHVYNTYIEGEINNKSRHIERLIILGSESLSGDIEKTKRDYLKILDKNRKLTEEIHQLKAELGKFKELHTKAKLRQEFLDDPKDKCIECNGYIEGKAQKFPKGLVCGACYMTANVEKMKKWGLVL